MSTEWRVTQKPDFFKALLALSPKETHQVLEKINLPFPSNQCDLDTLGECYDQHRQSIMLSHQEGLTKT